MLKHQTLFLATMESLAMEEEGYGERVFGELQASLESYGQAERWLAAAEAGDTAVVSEVLTSHQIDDVSLEAVQVHVNSAQLQAVIDFLKKWIPIVLRKIRDLAEQLISWARIKARRIGERLRGVEETVRMAVSNEYVVSVGDSEREQAAFYFLDRGHARELVAQTNELKAMLSICRELSNAVVNNDKIAHYDLPKVIDRFQTMAVAWVGFGNSSFFTEGSLTARIMGNYYAAKTLKDLPAVDDTHGRVRKELAERGRKMGKRFFGKNDIVALTNELGQAQLNLITAVNGIDGDLRSIRTSLEHVKPERVFAGGQIQPEDAEPVQHAFKMVNYTLSAAGSGLQFRLSLLGEATSLLERIVK